MTEVHDKSDDGKTGARSDATRRREEWQRPSFRKLQTGEAELGVTHSAPDGIFTTS